MKHYKNFTQYFDSEHPYMKLSTGALLLKCEDSNDWYMCQQTFQPDTVKVVYDEDGVVVDHSTDVYRLVPFNCSVIEFDKSDVPNDDFKNSYVVVNGKLKKRKPSTEKLKSDFEIEKQKRLTSARDVLHSVELITKNNMSITVDQELVSQWEKYFINLMVVEYSKGFVFEDEPKKPF